MFTQFLLIAFLSFALAAAMLVVRNDRRQIRTMRRILQTMIRQPPTKDETPRENDSSKPGRR